MNATEQGKYKRVQCLNCNLPMNFATKQDIDYTLSKANNRVWCPHCQRYVYFSLKHN